MTNPTPLAVNATATAVCPQMGGLNLTASLTHPSWGVGMAGTLEDFTPGEVKLALEGLVSQGTLVDVRIGASAFAGEVLFCERRGPYFETHVSINDFDESGLRRTPRFPVNLPGTVHAAALAAPAPATIVDISGDGLGLELAEQLPVNATIAVESDSNIALGVVRYSREIEPFRFRAGVQLHHIIPKNAPANISKPRIGLLAKMTSRLAFGAAS